MSDQKTNGNRIQRLSRELRAVNEKIRHILTHLPLEDHKAVARLNHLLDTQAQLMRKPTGKGPPAETIFFENAQHTARFLQQRYRDAAKRGLLRRAKTDAIAP